MTPKRHFEINWPLGRPQKFEKISQIIWHLQRRRQINWKISPSFVTVLENLNFLCVCHCFFCSSGFLRRSEKFDEISLLIWRLLSQFQIKWEIPSTFLAFLENLNFICICKYSDIALFHFHILWWYYWKLFI